ncbi:MAG: flavodoxin family protein [Planctomycetes bacterium]|nr:flavodoxin family protein [Planctomycetota bacterium]
MSLHVLGISSSPRARSNSDALLGEALRGAETGGARTEHVRLSDLAIAPCRACEACAKTGECVIRDDFQPLLAKLLQADRLVFATPVHFMGVASQGKVFIDRCQSLWSRKYRMKRPLFAEDRDRRALVIAVGGSKVERMFDGIRLTMRYWFDTLEMGYFANLFVQCVDAAGTVRDDITAMGEACRLGAALADPDALMPAAPTDIVLTGHDPGAASTHS